MYIGVANMIPGHLADITPEDMTRVTDLGFTGASIHMTDHPDDISPEIIERTKALYADHGLTMPQFWGFYPSLISDDESTRAEGIATAQKIIELGGKLGAACIGMRPGSFNPKGEWWPHPRNYAPEIETRLVESLRETAKACESVGIPITMECHVTVTLKSPQAVRRIIQRTGSEWVKMNLDPVNFIGDYEKAFNPANVIRELFDELSEHIFIAHVKDYTLGDDFVVHISEATPGDGIMDFGAFFREYEALLPEGYALIEHLPMDEVPRAKAFVDAKVKELGIRVRG